MKITDNSSIVMAYDLVTHTNSPSYDFPNKHSVLFLDSQKNIHTNIYERTVLPMYDHHGKTEKEISNQIISDIKYLATAYFNFNDDVNMGEDIFYVLIPHYGMVSVGNGKEFLYKVFDCCVAITPYFPCYWEQSPKTKRVLNIPSRFTLNTLDDDLTVMDILT